MLSKLLFSVTKYTPYYLSTHSIDDRKLKQARFLSHGHKKEAKHFAYNHSDLSQISKFSIQIFLYLWKDT